MCTCIESKEEEYVEKKSKQQTTLMNCEYQMWISKGKFAV